MTIVLTPMEVSAGPCHFTTYLILEPKLGARPMLGSPQILARTPLSGNLRKKTGLQSMMDTQVCFSWLVNIYVAHHACNSDLCVKGDTSYLLSKCDDNDANEIWIRSMVLLPSPVSWSTSRVPQATHQILVYTWGLKLYLDNSWITRSLRATVLTYL